MLSKVKSLLTGNKNILSLYVYKGIYQVIYLVFNFFILKKLSISEFGNYSYLLATIVYLNSFIALGFPIYLQKHFSRGEPLDRSYIYVVISNFIIAILILLAFIDFPIFTKGIIFLILIANLLSALVSTLYNAIEDYSQQYKILVLGSIWYVVLLAVVFFLKQSISLEQVLNYWAVNSILLSFFLVFQLRKFLPKFKWETGKLNIKYAVIAMFTIYAVGFPYEFSRFFDKWLIKEKLSEEFLGLYAFNLFVIMTVFSFFIRPLGSILITNLSKAGEDLQERWKAMSLYFLVVLAVFVLLIVFYLPLNNWLLGLVGLEQYQDTSYIFLYLLLSLFFYAIAVPGLVSLNLGEDNKARIIFVTISIILFAIMYSLVHFSPSPTTFLIAFTAYNFVSLLLCLFLDKNMGKMISFLYKSNNATQ